jgi:hypothetical protein
MNVLPGFPDRTYSETSSVFSDDSGIARARKMSGSSGNISPVYVYPVGRSRAQPKLVQSGPKSPRLGKFPGSAGSGEGEGKRTGFMSKLLKKKTKAPKSVDGSNTNSTNSPVESELKTMLLQLRNSLRATRRHRRLCTKRAGNRRSVRSRGLVAIL